MAVQWLALPPHCKKVGRRLEEFWYRGSMSEELVHSPSLLLLWFPGFLPQSNDMLTKPIVNSAFVPYWLRARVCNCKWLFVFGVLCGPAMHWQLVLGVTCLHPLTAARGSSRPPWSWMHEKACVENGWVDVYVCPRLCGCSLHSITGCSHPATYYRL